MLFSIITLKQGSERIVQLKKIIKNQSKNKELLVVLNLKYLIKIYYRSIKVKEAKVLILKWIIFQKECKIL